MKEGYHRNSWSDAGSFFLLGAAPVCPLGPPTHSSSIHYTLYIVQCYIVHSFCTVPNYVCTISHQYFHSAHQPIHPQYMLYETLHVHILHQQTNCTKFQLQKFNPHVLNKPVSPLSIPTSHSLSSHFVPNLTLHQNTKTPAGHCHHPMTTHTSNSFSLLIQHPFCPKYINHGDVEPILNVSPIPLTWSWLQCISPTPAPNTACAAVYHGATTYLQQFDMYS